MNVRSYTDEESVASTTHNVNSSYISQEYIILLTVVTDVTGLFTHCFTHTCWSLELFLSFFPMLLDIFSKYKIISNHKFLKICTTVNSRFILSQNIYNYNFIKQKDVRMIIFV